MSKNVKVVLNSAGVQELLKSAGIAGACEQQAARMSAAAGVAYKADVYVGKTRVNAKANVGNSKLGQERTGKQVSGYYRTTKGGGKVWVQSYRRTK